MNLRRKIIFTVLLVCACILSGIMLAATPAIDTSAIKTEAQLDSLIQNSLREANISPRDIRIRTISFDTTFSRKEFRIGVPPTFSKTSFHLQLQHSLSIFDFESPARVALPENNMYIYLSYAGSVRRTIRLITTVPTKTE